MVFKDIDSKLEPSYNSANDDIVNDFYNLALSEAIKYDRISGFFNSTSLAIAARGIDKFIKHDGHMRLICGAKLSSDDLESINNSEDLKNILDINFLKDYESIEDELIENHVKVLGWMVANNYLDIKIGVNRKNDGFYESGMLHSKIGIMYDDSGDSILFDGSVNETAYGWKNNIESLNVFKSWKNPEFMVNDKKDFENFWEGNNPFLDIFEVPEATKNKLIEIAPKSKEEVLNLKLTSEPKLRDYQEEAIKNWFNNDCKGIFEMATGTGKTFTALACFKKLKDSKNSLVTIIACPQSHLIDQWEDNVKKFYDGEIIIASSKNSHWKTDMNKLYTNFLMGIFDDVVILTTHKSLSSKFFRDIIKKINIETFLIVDEVHGMGSSKQSIGLDEFYTQRLGLSATPERWFDDEGTSLIKSFFGDVIFKFDLSRALNEVNPDTGETYLTHYNYYPIIIDLNDEEYAEYYKYSLLIASLLNSKNKNEENLSILLNKRQRIVNNAAEKYGAFRKILKKHKNISKLIVFCSPQQINNVQKILDEEKITPQHRFTQKESAKNPKNDLSERKKLLTNFDKGSYRALVAIKCLDEGVDVPSAENAIILSSTSNPREHIQRRGRILRRFPGKDLANIFDILVFPKENTDSCNTIRRKEIKRYIEFAKNADNSYDCYNILKKYV